MWFKKQQSNAVTALRCSQDATYIAKVAQKKNSKPFVSLIATEASSLIAPEATQSTGITQTNHIKKLVDRYQLGASNVTFLLEHNDCHLIQIEKPNVPDEEMKEAARWAIKDAIDVGVDDITLDFVNIPVGKSGEDTTHEYIYVMYANNDHLSTISNAMYQDKINLKAIDSRIMAQRNIANRLAEPEKALALLTLNSAGALLTFSHEGELCNARFIDIALDQTETSFEKLSLEVQRTLDGFESNFRNMFVDKVLVAPFGYRDELCAHLRESLYVKVDTFELTDIFDFAENAKLASLSDQGRFLPILGAALRDEATA